MNRRSWIVLLCCCFGFCGCGESDANGNGGNDDASVDSVAPDGSDGDADVADSNEADRDTPGDAQTDTQTDAGTDTGSDTGSDTENDVVPTDTGADTADAKPVDFEIRKPEKTTVHCPATAHNPESDQSWMQVDHVCTYDHNGKTGRIYVQATPSECNQQGMGPLPIYEIDKAVIKIGESIEELDNPSYDFGGGHANDFLIFEYDGVRFKYYHSSFGFGWRVCQEMDCAVVSNLSGTVLVDGCTAERTLPIVCKQVDEKGQYDETMTDTYKKCPGDPNG